MSKGYLVSAFAAFVVCIASIIVATACVFLGKRGIGSACFWCFAVLHAVAGMAALLLLAKAYAEKKTVPTEAEQ